MKNSDILKSFAAFTGVSTIISIMAFLLVFRNSINVETFTYSLALGNTAAVILTALWCLLKIRVFKDTTPWLLPVFLVVAQWLTLSPVYIAFGLFSFTSISLWCYLAASSLLGGFVTVILAGKQTSAEE